MGTNLSKKEFIEALRKIDLPEIFGFDISAERHTDAMEMRKINEAKEYLQFRELCKGYIHINPKSENIVIRFFASELERILLPERTCFESERSALSDLSDLPELFEIDEEEDFIAIMKHEDIEEAKALVTQMFILLEVYYPITTTVRILGNIESLLNRWEEMKEEEITKNMQ